MPERKCRSASRLEIERRRAKRRRVQPGPRFRRGHGLVEQVRRRRGPPRRGQRAPLESFAVGDVGVPRAREGRRRHTVVLDSEPDALLRRPLAHRHEEPLLEQLGQRPAVVAPDRVGALAGAELRHRQQRLQIVSAARSEFVEERRRPVRVVHLEAVAEHRVDRSRFGGAPAACRPPREDADRSRRGCSDPARSRRRPRPPASPPARSGPRNRTARREGRRRREGESGRCRERSARERSTDRLPARSRVRRTPRPADRARTTPAARWSSRRLRSRAAPIAAAWPRAAGVMYGPPNDQPLPSVRSMRRPSSRARRDVNAILSRNAADRYGSLTQSARWIVDRQRVHRRDLEAADAALFHVAHLGVELLARHGGTEPPPPHHDPAVGGRIHETGVGRRQRRVRRRARVAPELARGRAPRSGWIKECASQQLFQE